MHMASVTSMVTSLLCGKLYPTQNDKISQQLQPLQVALCDIEKQNDKLGLLSAHLWSQAAVLSHPSYTPRFVLS